uniref:CYP450 n=1 Tax=Locusta migratoria TaxID=7004 RepID=A0A6F8H0W3_LOCMI|nr:CYP450 [Locusta migratoria]
MAWWWSAVQLVTWSVAAVVAALSWLWITRPRVDAPGPPTLPIIGNALQLCQLPATIRKFREFHRQYGDLTRLYAGPILVMLVTHPDDVQHILVTSRLVDRDPFTTYAMRLFVGDGLITNKGAQWKLHRKLISSTFHSELLEGFVEAFHEGGVSLSERLAKTKGASTELYALTFGINLRLVFRTIIGIDPDLLLPDAVAEEEFALAMSDAMTTIQRMMVRPWLQIQPLLWLTSKGRKLFRYVQMLQELAKKCVAIRSAATDETPAKSRPRLLEILIKPGGQTVIPLEDVQNEIVNMIVAAVEAVSLTTCYALTLLALHQEWQDAAHQELREIFGEGDDYLRPANMADLGRLRVLDSVIKETLRLFPPLSLIPRVAPEDFWLSKGQVFVPKGTLLAVAPFITHRLPEFFPDPLKFDPSRFLEERAGKEHPYSYLPFGLGARNCMGTQYARLLLKVLLVEVLRRFRIQTHISWEDLDDGILSVTQHPIKPIKVSCIPLHQPGI